MPPPWPGQYVVKRTRYGETITRPQPKSWGNCAGKPGALLPGSHCYFARLTGDQGSGILLSMVQGQGLAIIPEDVIHLPIGARVQVMMLDWAERG